MRLIAFFIAALFSLPALAASSQICIIYSTEAVQLRRVVLPDDDIHLAACAVADGETLLMAPRDADIPDAIRKAAGIAPTLPVAAVVDANGTVTAVIAADPVLDTVPAASLVIADDGVSPGDKFDRLSRSFKSADGLTVRGKARKIPLPHQTLGDMQRAVTK